MKIRAWRAFNRNTLRGFVEIEMPSGMIVSEITIHIKDSKAWASPPGKPMLDRDGAPMRDENGKVRYSQVIDFASKDLRNRWSSAIIEALRAVHPEAFYQ